jgi:hypothetical protein
VTPVLPFAQRIEILNSVKNVAIVGVSDKPDRPSYGVTKWLLAHTDLNLFFVNPVITELFGKPVYKSLVEIPEKIDLVDVFRNPKDMAPIMDDAIKIGAKFFWMQLGISEAESAAKGIASGLTVVEDACIKVDYEKLLLN